MNKILVAALATVFALLPSFAFADNGSDGGLLLRIRGDVVVPAGETISRVVVIDGNAVIDGTVDSVTVIRGNADVSGTVGERLTVISGDITLRSNSSVKNVDSARGDLIRAPNATVTGKVRERDNFTFAGGVVAIFSLFFWLGMTVAVVVAAIIFAAVGGRQLTASAKAMTEAVPAILGIVFTSAALPILAFVAIITLVGIPLGIGVLVFLLPALWFLGFIVAGTRLGGWLVGLAGRDAGEHPFAAATVGVVILQLIVLVPVLGALVALFAGVWGAGALAVTAFRAAGGKGFGTSAQGAATRNPQPEPMS